MKHTCDALALKRRLTPIALLVSTKPTKFFLLVLFFTVFAFLDHKKTGQKNRKNKRLLTERIEDRSDSKFLKNYTAYNSLMDI